MATFNCHLVCFRSSQIVDRDLNKTITENCHRRWLFTVESSFRLLHVMAAVFRPFNPFHHVCMRPFHKNISCVILSALCKQMHLILTSVANLCVENQKEQKDGCKCQAENRAQLAWVFCFKQLCQLSHNNAKSLLCISEIRVHII